MLTIGVLSDTHGTLHPELLPAFEEATVRLILHAGDVGSYAIIRALERLAPVHAVRGNIDHNAELGSLPEECHLALQGVSIYMTHVGDKPDAWLPRLPRPAPHVAICGHSHIPLLARTSGTLFLNPGAAGTRPRFGQPLTAALLRLENGAADAEIIHL